MKRILVLRPEPGASTTVKRAKERGLDAVAVPLFEVEPVDWEVPDAGSFDGLLLTSANAIRHAGDRLPDLRGLKVYAVGSATAEAARDAGFDVASAGEAGVDRLLGSLDPELRLLHLGGEDRRTPEDARQEIRSITVYRARPRDDIEVGNVDGSIALIHSSRAGKRFAELLKPAAKPSVAIAAISAEAGAAAGDGWAKVEAAETPSDDALLALAERLCNNTPAK
jgi:uroporphyrinogen-III synthase